MFQFKALDNATICALSTPPGIGAIGLIRLTGTQAISICEKVFSKKLSNKAPNSLHYGKIKDADKVIDEVVVALFKAPHSFTGEDVVEVSCHGSPFILRKCLDLFIQNGARMAQPGEFSLRAFLNNKMDLTQAEAIADLIDAQSDKAHEMAIKQLRGGFSSEIKILREKLINFASLIELELDFSEEDVEFADRSALEKALNEIIVYIEKLIHSFQYGNAIKNGISVAIVGKPNAGKSTLLNALFNEEKALVTEIAGTTRDSIEDTLHINGMLFRFIDTAGLRETTDRIESMGVQRSYEKLKTASIVLYLFDINTTTIQELKDEISLLRPLLEINNCKLIPLANKIDLLQANSESINDFAQQADILFISAAQKTDIDSLKMKLLSIVEQEMKFLPDSIVSNSRHVEALTKSQQALHKAKESLQASVSGDLLALDIRQAIHYLSDITGEFSIDKDILGTIFSKFCIGK
jgi:tRNA modification GTPase